MNKKRYTSLLDHKYWLVGNSIDGVCCFPRKKHVRDRELINYLETDFLIDFNASRGEFDVTIYLDAQGFRLRQRYGYYLEGPRRNVIAQVDYMTADAIHRMRRCGRTFWYYGRPTAGRKDQVLRIALPKVALKTTEPFQIHRKQKSKNAKRDAL
jgi:hypothetical protein